MLKKIIIIGGLVALVVTLAILIDERNSSEKDKLSLEGEVLSLNNEITNLESQVADGVLIQFYNWKLNNDKVINATIKDLASKQKSLHSILGKNSIIFYFNNTMCSDCLNKELENLKTLEAVVGRDNIILIAEGFKTKYLQTHDKYKLWQERLYTLKGDLFSVSHNLSNTPSIVLLNEDMQVKTAYHAMKNTNLNFEFFVEFLKSEKVKKETQ